MRRGGDRNALPREARGRSPEVVGPEEGRGGGEKGEGGGVPTDAWMDGPGKKTGEKTKYFCLIIDRIAWTYWRRETPEESPEHNLGSFE